MIDIAAVLGIGVNKQFLDRQRPADHPLLVAIMGGADGVTGEIDEDAGR
jgi:hypothetical protein